MDAYFDASMKSVEEIFAPRVSYLNPPLQRPYVWSTSQWSDLWDDVLCAVRNQNDANHFLGAIVVQLLPRGTEHLDRPLVVDGQQRLTTLQLLLAAIRDVAASGVVIADESGVADGHLAGVAARVGDLLLNSAAAAASLDDRCKIRHSYSRDRVAFQGIMASGRDSLPGVASEGMVKCYDFYRSRVARESVGQLERAVTGVIRLAVVEIGHEVSLYTVFGRLNANGTPLSGADYIKNEVIRRLDALGVAERDAVEPLWIFDEDWWREDTASTPSSERRVESCIRHWLSDTLGRTVSIGEMHHVCVDYLDRVGVSRFLVGLNEYALCYRVIEDNGHSCAVTRFLAHVRQLRQFAVMPLLVRLCLTVEDPDDLAAAIAVLDSYLMRRALCGAKSAGLNKYSVELAVKIRRYSDEPRLFAGALPYAALLRQEFESVEADETRYWPTDARLLREGCSAAMSGALRQMLFLTELELEIGGALQSGEQYTVEHVIPRRWRRNWFPDADDLTVDSANAAVHTIGNLTLLPPASNNRASDAGWIVKRRALQASANDIRLNQHLLEHVGDSWGLDDVHGRSERLLRLAASRWPGPRAA